MFKGFWISILLIVSALSIDVVSNTSIDKDQSAESLNKYIETTLNKYTSTFLDKRTLDLLNQDSLSFNQLSRLKKLETDLEKDRVSVRLIEENKLIYWHTAKGDDFYCQDSLVIENLSLQLCLSLFDEEHKLFEDLYEKCHLQHFVFRNLTTEGFILNDGSSVIIGDRFRSYKVNYLILFLFILGFSILIFSGLKYKNQLGIITAIVLRIGLGFIHWKDRFASVDLSNNIFNDLNYASIELLLDTLLIFGVLNAFANYQFSNFKKRYNYLYAFVNFIFLGLLFVSHIKLIQLLVSSDQLKISVNNIQGIDKVDTLVFLSILLLKAGIFIYATSFILNLKKQFKRKEIYMGFFLCILMATVFSKVFLLEINPFLLSGFLALYFVLIDLFIDIKDKDITWIIWWGIFFGVYLSALFFTYDIKNEIVQRQNFLQKSFYEIPTKQKQKIISSGILDTISKEVDKILTLPEEAKYDPEDLHAFINQKIDRDDVIIRVFNKQGESLLPFTKKQYPLLRLGKDQYFDELQNELWFHIKTKSKYIIHCGFLLDKYDHQNTYKFNYIAQGKPFITGLKLSQKEVKDILDSANEVLYKGPQALIKYEPRPGHFLIAQKSFSSRIKPIALFSFFFSSIILLILILSLVNSLVHFLPEDWPFKIKKINSLNSKIQISLILIILLSFFVIALITSSSLKSFISSKNETIINEKLGSIIRDLKDKTSIAETENEVVIIASNYESKLESIHNADLDIILLKDYNSANTYFPFAYFSKQNEPKAFTDNKTGKELINYLPLKFKNKVVGYNKVTYYQDQLKQLNVIDFLGSIFNVYVFLFFIVSVIAIFIAQSISKPIALLNQKLSQVKLGKANELIKWDKEDEIGMLIKNYNKMVNQLEESAELLAKTERDSAWREMAKQVAHEIKNPLTPMKMYIQHLEKAIKQQPENAIEISKKISATLLEQIENLTGIADSFGNVAELPQSYNVKIELNKVVELVHNLFRKREDMDIMLSEPIDPIYVYADKNQLIRILNNLVKNAIESIPADRKGKIHLSLYAQENKALIKVSDNGMGVPEEMKSKIFQPKFTTKDSGSGLGLAIASNMIESMNGRLYFESDSASGTNFYIELDIIRQTNFEDQSKRITLD